VTDSLWNPFANGTTLGQPGSERGIIVHDEEHSHGARIPLERDTHTAPFAIACGVYGCMLHTRFFASQAESGAQYGLMKNALGTLLESAAIEGSGSTAFLNGISEFVEKYP
jgi:hypothetical protein